MSSPVDICNLALGHIGDAATVASLDPPEGSAQAEHCARFYAIARDSLLEVHDWDFCTRRIVPAQLAAGTTEWAYAYARPTNCLRVIAVHPAGASDDLVSYPMSAYPQSTYGGGSQGVDTTYVPQPFICETDADGNELIYTNQAGAVVRYTVRIEDSAKFSPLFVVALSWHLASMLAGPVIKGESGATEAKRCEGMMERWLAKATGSDARQRRTPPQHLVSWMEAR